MAVHRVLNYVGMVMSVSKIATISVADVSVI